MACRSGTTSNNHGIVKVLYRGTGRFWFVQRLLKVPSTLQNRLIDAFIVKQCLHKLCNSQVFGV